jgi:energy-converting hydrogenase Eha subunit A
MRICIYTQKSVEGQLAVPVRDDRVIRTIRAVKKFFGIAQMNELYVSVPHLEEHKKRRRSFEKSLLFASVFAGLVIVVVLFSLVFSGRFDLWAIVSAFIIAGFVLALPLFKYSPALEAVDPKVVGRAASPPPKAAAAQQAVPPAAAKPAAPAEKAAKRPRKKAKKTAKKKGE